MSALYFYHVKYNGCTIVQNDFRSSCDYKHQFKVQSFDVADWCLLYLKVLPLIIDIFFVIKGVNVMHKIMADGHDTCSFIFNAKNHINVAMLPFLQKWQHSLVRIFVYYINIILAMLSIGVIFCIFNYNLYVFDEIKTLNWYMAYWKMDHYHIFIYVYIIIILSSVFISIAL